MPARLPNMKRLLSTCALALLILSGCSAHAATPPRTLPAAMTALATPPVPATTTTVAPDVEPPAVTTSPPDGATVDWYQGEFVVMTEPGALVTVDGRTAEASKDGTYMISVANTPGTNVIHVKSTDGAGNTTDERIRYEYGPNPGWAAAVGDSVMLGSKGEIEGYLGDDTVDGTVSRQFLSAPALVADLVARPDPPEVIVVGLGTNGPVQERHFDEVMEIAGPERLVVFVNVRMPRTWEAESNEQIASGVDRYSNATLADWYTVTEDRRDLFAGDRVHPSKEGRVALADLIAATIFRGTSQGYDG